MADYTTRKQKDTVGLRVDLPKKLYQELKILAAMHGLKGAKPECEQALKYWVGMQKEKVRLPTSETTEDEIYLDEHALKNLQSEPIRESSKSPGKKSRT